MTSSSSSSRMPVCRSVSMMAQTRNASSSSRVTSNCSAVAVSSISTISGRY
ncbi:hypothetical protein [Streptomyces sp. ISL-11]|uniref:hypothetical protein n=1 Tax=Streptomyces sp. ISL-11 TaxID=2819174 RepID=UPI001BECFB6F|nr:hypothetical protein [Streptomyces sp. ISL-11]MBT2384940.1 hypothetical protein [Streptomyces sp. ISL-11]